MRKLVAKGLDVLAYAFFVAVAILIVRLATPDAKAHDGYEKWMQPHRPAVSCCNNHDCEPVAARYDEKRRMYQALIEGTWTDIPPHIILDQNKIENVNFDGSYHACWNRTTKELLCFREADPKIWINEPNRKLDPHEAVRARVAKTDAACLLKKPFDAQVLFDCLKKALDE